MAGSCGRVHRLLEEVVEPFILEVVFFLGDPFLQSEMRCDNEFIHLCFLLLGQQQALITAASVPCSATRRARIIFTWSSIKRRAALGSCSSINLTRSRCADWTCSATSRVRVGL